MVTPLEARVVEGESLRQLANYNLMLNSPYIHNIGYADYVQNIYRTSSDYIMFATSIPFKQLVLNGLVNTKEILISEVINQGNIGILQVENPQSP